MHIESVEDGREKLIWFLQRGKKTKIMRHSFSYKNSLIQQLMEQFLSLPH